MKKNLLNGIALILPGIMAVVAIAASPRTFEPAIQNKTNLRILVSGQKSGQTVAIAGADVIVRSDHGDFLANPPPTDSQGVASVDDIPFGKYLIQANAAGWKPDGHTYDLNKKEQTIVIQLKPTEERAPSPSPTPAV